LGDNRHTPFSDETQPKKAWSAVNLKCTAYQGLTLTLTLTLPYRLRRCMGRSEKDLGSLIFAALHLLRCVFLDSRTSAVPVSCTWPSPIHRSAQRD